MTFKAEAATSKALRALSSLYRQDSMGDAAGVRRGVIDVRRRAKFDAGSRAMARHASNPWPTP